jgi:Na+-transporting NADH:ubiquinone oxidoreductase subunit B
MKFLRNILDNVRPHFSKGGRFEKLHYPFDALETFLFSPGTTTSGTGVHVRDAMDLKRTMFTVIIALVPCLLFGIWNTGFQHYKAYGVESSLMQNVIFGMSKALPMIIVSYAAGLAVEFIFSIIRHHPISEGYLVTGLLIPLTLPVTTPLWMIALAAIFCTLLGKEVFGGTGYNFMNPALLARAFLFFAFPAYMSGEIWTDLSAEAGHKIVDGYSGATNLVAFDTDFHKMPDAMTLFWGFEQGSLGETSVAACLIGALILIITGVGSGRIIVSVFLGAYLMGLLLNLIAPSDLQNHSMHTPPHLHWLIGSFAFGAVFMATDPVSAAQTATGKIIYGLMIGAFTVILRVFNPAYPEGMMLSILLMNVFAPLIDHLVVERHIKSRLSRAKVKN